MIAKKSVKNLLFVLTAIIIQFSSIVVYAETSSSPVLKYTQRADGGGGGEVSGSGTVMPDLFTGTMSYSIPIEVVPGRKGIQPNLALTYRSNNGNGWVGVGWDLEIGAIERSASNGVDYSADKYILRMAGSAIDLISISTNSYRAKIEGAFLNVNKIANADGSPNYWVVYDKSGVKYTFGKTAYDSSAPPKQYDPANPSRVFKWCLDRKEDANGNFMTFSYIADQGQIYPNQIDYTGNSNTSAATTNYVKFYTEDRTDAPTMYSTNFSVITAKRLKTIDVWGDGYRVRAYRLTYATSPSTSRSRLGSFQQFDKDAAVNTNGDVTGSALPATILSWQDTASLGLFSDTNNSTPAWINDPNTQVIVGDFNGDGKMDFALKNKSYTTTPVFFSNGDGTWNVKNISYNDPAYGQLINNPNTQVIVGDFNGDGKTDIALKNKNYTTTPVFFSKGDGTWNTTNLSSPSTGWINDPNTQVIAADFNGFGETSIALINSSYGSTPILFSGGLFPDLLNSISNGLGGVTTISYTPSTQYANTQLPFPVQTVSSVTTCDNYNISTSACDGNSSTTNYTYSGGFYHIGERDFRGFNYLKTAGPTGPNEEQRIVETWFHQGNDTAVDANSPNVPTGYMKGKPYRTRVSDASGAIYTETTILYSSGTGSAPFFNPPLQVDTYNCDGKLGSSCAGNTAAQHIQMAFRAYDQYGNVKSEYQSGDINDPTDTSTARTVNRNYVYNATAWIINSLANETIYSGATGTKVASTSYFYDGTTTCTTASTSQPPTKGNPTCIARWVDGGANDPSVGMTYDAYGNLLTTRDPRGNTSRIGYDGTSTFPTTATNALSQNTTMQYYAGTSTDSGLYGQVQSVTDPNGAVTTMTYDTFGRKTRATAPDGTWMSWSYPITPGTGTSTNVFGSVGSQNNEIDTSAGISTWIYFDGLGRTIAEKKTGINGKVVTTTSYNTTGTVAQTSLPYFENTQQPSLITYTYDAMGRTTGVNNPDGTSVSSCYDNGVTVVIDANTHFKRATKNVQGKLVKVEEYEGTLAGCTTNIGTTPYAKTTYSYDVLGDLLSVTDNKLNITQMRYDSLGRKIYMSDPDMGVWQYGYDLNGNLLSQTDAKGQIITFTYDALNRVKLKHYQTGTDVSYTYDVKPDASTTITYPVGRRSTMTDASGSTKYFYDIMGRSSTMTKTVDGTPYTTVASYDNGGRLASLRYPDTDVINYFYDAGGNLKLVSGASTTTNYATYSNYNALGQPGNIAYGNGVNTTYTYNASNNRLTSLVTNGPNSTALLNLSYGYDYVGNITGITDGLNAARSQTFGYDELNRLTHANSASYVSNSYGPWQSGMCDEWVQQCPSGTGIDTCNSDSWNQFTCPSNSISMSCNDVYDYVSSDQDYYYYRTVSCGPQPSYVYDEIGNILSKEGINYDQYGLNAGPHAVTHTSDGKTYTYDANGNMKSDGQRIFTWNYDNMPATVTNSTGTSSFLYDGTGTRVVKTTPHGGTTKYIGKLYECKVSGTCNKYIFAGGQLIADKAGASVQYYHADYLGSTSVVTDATGSSLGSIYYYPFGATMAGDVPASHKYTSQEFDAETGLYNYNARLYNPSLGRFISPDTIVPGPSNPQAFNRYSYVLNNPLNFADPSGYWRISVSFHYFVGGDLSYDSNNNHFRGGAGVGMGGGVSVGNNNWDVGASNEWYVDYGYDNKLKSDYVTAKYGQGVQAFGSTYGVGASGTYYTRYDEYQVSAGAGCGYAGVNAGYSSFGDGSWSLGTSYAGTGATYDFGSKSWHYSEDPVVASKYYKENTGQNATTKPGSTLLTGKYNAGFNGGRPPYGVNVFGLNQLLIGNFWGDFFTQGGPLSNAANSVGLNSIAVLHDYWMNNMSFNIVTNVGTMIPAAVITGAALLGNVWPQYGY